MHISIAEGYTIPILKRIAQAAIHFEPAFEAILPRSRRGIETAMSNWVDNPQLGHLGYKRSECIDKIEKCRFVSEVVDLMSPDRHYGWNFTNLVGFKKTIEFRRGPVSTNVKNVLIWVEIVMTFVQIAIPEADFRTKLRQYEPNVGGLEEFLLSGNMDRSQGMNRPDIFQKFFKSFRRKQSIMPYPITRVTPKH